MPQNILLACLVCTVAFVAVGTASAAEDKDAGFVSIFDGKTLAGWDGDPQLWRVEDGAITGQTVADPPLKENTFLIWRQGELDDFELKIGFRIFGGNSGIQYRSFQEPKWARWVVGGYQADIDATDQYTGILYGERYRGILAKRGEKTVIGDDHKPKVVEKIGDDDALKSAIRKGEWNEFHVIARGNHLVHKINDRVMVEVTDEDKAMRRRGGILALQLHVGPPMKVQFRNVRLKRLPMEDCKKVVFIAGPASHGYGDHEHNAGCLLLAKALNENMPGVYATVYQNGWPSDPTAFDNANAIVVFADGANGNPLIPHLDAVERLAAKGVGLGCMHYAVEMPKGKAGDSLLRWIGGYFETFWSVNPWWTAKFRELPEHPVTRGVRPFEIEDEWYYHMRFAKDMGGVTPILTAVPPEETRQREDGARSGNPAVRARKGMPEIVCWVFDRAAAGGVGRGFGFTGGHMHWSWAHDDYRKLVLNAVVWLAGVEVPRDGVPSATPTFEELKANQDQTPPKDFDYAKIAKRLEGWKKAGTNAPR